MSWIFLIICYTLLSYVSAIDILSALGFREKKIKQTLPYFDHALSLIHNRSGIVIDVGANGGNEIKKSLEKGREVLAIECLSSAYFDLLNAEFVQHSNVTLLHLCAGDKLGVMKLHLARDSSSLIPGNIAEGEEQVKAITQAKTGTNTEDVVVMPLDRFVNKEVSLIKIDTQGFEYNVVLGLQRTIKKYSPVIAYEDVALNPGPRLKWKNAGNTQKFLKENFGYTCERVPKLGIEVVCTV